MSASLPEGTENYEPPVVETPPVDDPPADSPAWQDVLNAVPESMHGLLRPKLEAWDKGVQDRFTSLQQQYDPYKPYIEAGYQPEHFNQGLQLLSNLSQDPVAFYRNMGEKLRAAGMLEEAEQAQNAADELEEEGEAVFKDPRLDQFMEQLSVAQQQLQEEQAVAQAERELEQEIVALETKVGKLEPRLLQEVLYRASVMHDQAVQARKPPPTLQQAYDATIDFVVHASKAKPAPHVIPGSGGGQPQPTAPKAAEYANDPSARRKAAVDFITAFHNRQQ